jgi:transposase InsO family protein
MQRHEDEENQRRQKVGLFRYGLISDLVHWPAGKRGKYALIREKCELDYEIPGSTRRRVAPETVRGWLSDYRKGGFDALLPKVRADAGHARALPLEAVDLLVEIKEENRKLTVTQVIAEAKRSGKLGDDIELALSTVHRLLSRRGLMTKLPEDPTSKDRRHFAFEKAGELWMSDVMHGPSVIESGKRKRKSYLLGLLDDATRIVPYAAFAFHENTAAFLPVLEQALRRRGRPKRLYVDNGALYRSQHLALVCAKLGVTLVHARPYQPQGKGKIERFFRTVRMQFLALVCAADLATLEALNRKLWAWIEGEYHQSPHKGLSGQSPTDRWSMSADEVELMHDDISDLFLFEAKRKVQRDRTVSLNGVLYEVDAALVDETVTLRFDPSRRGRPVQVWHRGKHVQVAKPVDAYANCFVRRDRRDSTLGPVPEPNGLRLIDFDAEQEGT